MRPAWSTASGGIAAPGGRLNERTANICIGECEFGQTDGIDHVACERMCRRARPAGALHAQDRSCDPKRDCPHPDEAFAKRWNNAPVYVAAGCGGSPSAPPLSRTQVDGFLTLRVRECKGHGKEKIAARTRGRAGSASLEGRSIQRSNCAIRITPARTGGFAAVARGKEGLPS